MTGSHKVQILPRNLRVTLVKNSSRVIMQTIKNLSVFQKMRKHLMNSSKDGNLNLRHGRNKTRIIQIKNSTNSMNRSGFPGVSSSYSGARP